MTLSNYVTSLEAAVLDLDAQADLYEERRRADLDWHLTIARQVAARALAVVRDEAADPHYRIGYALSALETIAGHRKAAA
jgi:hypothetical protein